MNLLIGLFKGINKDNKGISSILSYKCSDFLSLSLYIYIYSRFLASSSGAGGFRELREVGRNNCHLSWYLSVPVRSL